MFEMENFTIQLTNPMLYDRLHTLSVEYSMSVEQLVNMAVKRPDDKKLKKVSSVLASYITIDAKAVKDLNDKLMFSSYCIGKIELVEWYLKLLEISDSPAE